MVVNNANYSYLCFAECQYTVANLSRKWCYASEDYKNYVKSGGHTDYGWE